MRESACRLWFTKDCNLCYQPDPRLSDSFFLPVWWLPGSASFTSFPFFPLSLQKCIFVNMKHRDLDLFNLFYSSLTSAVGWYQPTCCIFCREMRSNISFKRKDQKRNWKFHLLHNGRLRWNAWRSFLKIMKTKLERRRKICSGSGTTDWAVSQFFHVIEFISTLSYRPTTSMSTACCTVGYATVSFSASTNRYVFKRWRSSGAEMHVCGAQSCLSARTSIQSDLSFIAA